MNMSEAKPKLPKFDMKLMEQWEKTIRKTKQRINMIICGRASEHAEYIEYYNWAGRLLRTKDKAKRIYGIGFTAYTGMQPLDRIYNRKTPVIRRIPYRKRNKETGEWETKYKNEATGEFIYGYRAIAKHLSKFIKISEDELKKLVAPYRDAPRIYIFSSYNEKGVSIHNQPDTIESFMGHKDFWKCSSGKPVMCNTAISGQRFLWLNQRIKQLAKKQGLKGYWEIRTAPFTEETI